MVERVRPAVVRISNAEGTGSGVIFEINGQEAYVLTNEHVVSLTSTNTVTVGETRNYTATVLGTDALLDLAVLRICCGRFTALPMGSATSIRPGLEVVSIGYALGLQGGATVTNGIVSAVRHDGEYGRWVVQADATINPGNSGGPMLSMKGEILGINTFKIEESATGRKTEGLGFAVSIQTIFANLGRLKSGAHVTAPDEGDPGPDGTVSGTLTMPEDALLACTDALEGARSMRVEVTFQSPGTQVRKWSYGLLLRDAVSSHLVSLSYNDGTSFWDTQHWDWSLEEWIEDYRHYGKAQGLLPQAGEWNTLRVVIIDGEVEKISVNDRTIANALYKMTPLSGDLRVLACIKFYTNDTLPVGATIAYKDFMVSR